MRYFFSKLFLLLMLCFAANTQAQTVKLLNSGSKASLRGLSVVSDDVVWVSGSAGSVGRSVDGGENWTWKTVPGFEKTDFRDIEAFDKNTAIIMGIADPAFILKTTDGGQNWKVVFKDTTKGMFLDAMEFWTPWVIKYLLQELLMEAKTGRAFLLQISLQPIKAKHFLPAAVPMFVN